MPLREGRGAPQVPRLPPDFLSDSVVSVKLMRLSSKKAAYVAVDECRVVGNPEFAPTARRGRRDDKGEGSAHLSSGYRGWKEPQVICDFIPLGGPEAHGSSAAAIGDGKSYRSSGTNIMGYLGRSVILGCTSTVCPGTNRSRHLCAMVATIRTPSIQAKASPIHCRLPAPKGK
jgi:hypothetical protein